MRRRRDRLTRAIRRLAIYCLGAGLNALGTLTPARPYLNETAMTNICGLEDISNPRQWYVTLSMMKFNRPACARLLHSEAYRGATSIKDFSPQHSEDNW